MMSCVNYLSEIYKIKDLANKTIHSLYLKLFDYVLKLRYL